MNDEEAEMIRKIYALYVEGESLRSLCHTLYSEGYRSRTGGAIAHNTVGSIIKNPKYKGYYVGGEVKTVDYRTRKRYFPVVNNLTSI
ncbi:recombinase family protein [Oscillospiraceae bacterium OttesenSCG-928-F05]|nr:recombinase family protein [Oscillospiraceae bacterium OttesenSCG-928-F05]